MIKKYVLKIVVTLFIVLPITSKLIAQGVGVNSNGNIPVDGAMLDISSTTSGLLIPRMTQAQRDLIEAGSPPQSLLIYQTDQDSGFYYYDGSSWIPFLVGGASINGGWETKGNTGTTPANNFIGTIDSVDWVIRTDSTEQMRVMANGNVGIGTTVPSSTHHISGSSAAKVSSITASSYTAGDETVILVDATSNKVTINLPAAAAAIDRTYTIKKIDATTDSVVVDANGSETLDGALQLYLTNENDFYTIICDGSAWYVTGLSSGDGAPQNVWLSSEVAVLTNGNATTWTDVDLSATVPAGATAVYLRYNIGQSFNNTTVRADIRKDGGGPVIRVGNIFPTAQVNNTADGMIVTPISVSRMIEYQVANDNTRQLDLWIVGYVLDNGASADGVPVGTVLSHMGPSAPTGYLVCDGSAVSRTTYATLFGVIGVMYGSGDGSTTFNLPDLRGYFLRGFDNTAGNDPDAGTRTDRGDGTTGDNIGTKQEDVLQNITGTIPLRNDEFNTLNFASGTFAPTGAFSSTSLSTSTTTQSFDRINSAANILETTFDASDVVRTSTETRPKNINVLYCIKY